MKEVLKNFKNKKIWLTLLPVIIVIKLILLLVIFKTNEAKPLSYKNNSSSTFGNKKYKMLYFDIQPNKTNENYELKIIRDDLYTYGYLSSKVIEGIINEIGLTSARYKIPPGLLHAIMRVESEYRFNVIHPTVTVSVKGTRVKTNAAGLGGIIWVLWKNELKKEGIAENELDLFIPENNIRAVGFILRFLINDEIKRNSMLTESTIMASIVKRYYGAHNQKYLKKMQKITSDLWMKRMANKLLSTTTINDSTNSRIIKS